MATLADLPLGATILIPVGTEENRLCEVADKNNLVSGGAVLVYKKIYEYSTFGSSALYPDGTLDNLIKNTIYNSFPQAVREKMMNVTFDLEGSGSITRKMFAITYTMAGFGTNNGTTEGKALQLYTSDASRNVTDFFAEDLRTLKFDAAYSCGSKRLMREMHRLGLEHGFATYVSLFPQLLAGPIVRYQTIQDELEHRKSTIADTAYGISRFMEGLFKKCILSNTLAELVMKLENGNEASVAAYWAMSIAFTLQIYFDFSGYSDMAIGLGRIFGFHFLENFNYPYLSKSISEFWRRWHMSLGTWFRDYVYIPLGGNRVPLGRWFLNIFVVWFLTGFWHGAQWNFIVWGLYFAFFLLIEKLFINNLLDKLPKFVRHIYVLFFINISFVIFNHDTMAEIGRFLGGMFGAGGIPRTNRLSAYYISSYGFVLLLSAFLATPALKHILAKLRTTKPGEYALAVLEPVAYAGILLLVTASLVNGSFNPFLYFRF